MQFCRNLIMKLLIPSIDKTALKTANLINKIHVINMLNGKNGSNLFFNSSKMIIQNDYDAVLITDDFYFEKPGFESIKTGKNDCFAIINSAGLMNEYCAARLFGKQRTVDLVYDEEKQRIYLGSLENGIYADKAASLFAGSRVKAVCLSKIEISRKKWEQILIDSSLMLFAVAARKRILINYETGNAIRSLVAEIIKVVEAAGILDFPFGDYVSQFKKKLTDPNWLSCYEGRLNENLEAKATLLNGYIAQLGRRYSVATPINNSLALIASLIAGKDNSVNKQT